MSDLRDLPDLASDVRERVVTPPYDEVSRRVRARRLRGAAGMLAAAVFVVGGVAVWQNAATTAGPSIPQPAETEGPIPPTDESQWRAVVDGTDAHVFEIQGTDDGSIAVVWRALEHPEPTFAVVVREADGTVHGRRLDEPVSLTPVPGGWVGVRTAQAWFIGSDGTWQDLGTPGEPRPSRAGDVVIHGQFGRWLFYTEDRTWSALGDRYGDFGGAYVTPAGDPVTCTGGAPGLRIERNGRVRVADEDSHTSSCLMVGRGDTVVVAGVGDAPDGATPLKSVQISHDGGLTWRWQAHLMASLTSLVVLPDGTWATTSTDGGLHVTPSDGSQPRTDEGHGLGYAVGNRLCTLSLADARGPASCTSDHGISWVESPLPGMESSEE